MIETTKTNRANSQIVTIVAVLAAVSGKAAANHIQEAKEILAEASKAVCPPKQKVQKQAPPQPPGEILASVGRKVSVMGWNQRKARGGVPGAILDSTGIVTGYSRVLGVWELLIHRDGAAMPTRGIPLDRVTFI